MRYLRNRQTMYGTRNRGILLSRLPEERSHLYLLLRGKYWVEGVSSGSKYQAEAVEFITYLSSRDVMTKLFAESSKTRLFGNPYSRTDLADEMRKHNFLVPIVDSAPPMYSWYVSSRTQDEGINDRIIAYFRNALNAIYQGSSPEGELQTVSAGVTQVMSDYSLTPP